MITYVENFVIDPDEAFRKLESELEWERRGTVPRYEYYVNAIDVPYTYGISDFARTYDPRNTHPIIDKIKESVERYSRSKYEVCFLNRYTNQSDHLGWHADDSPEMDDSRPIAIVSLGVDREIWFKNNESGEVEKKTLKNGSLCLMPPGMQDTHKHRIPKASRICGSRISLTFRGYKT